MAVARFSTPVRQGLVERVDDLAEWAVETAIDTDALVEDVRGPAAEALLAEGGRCRVGLDLRRLPKSGDSMEVEQPSGRTHWLRRSGATDGQGSTHRPKVDASAWIAGIGCDYLVTPGTALRGLEAIQACHRGEQIHLARLDIRASPLS